jgi:hypothetical protein
MPVVIGIIVVVVAAVGIWLWRSGSAPPSDVKSLSETVNQGKPQQAAPLPPDTDTMMMGGKKGGR